MNNEICLGRLRSIRIDYGFKLVSLVTARYFTRDKPVVSSIVNASGMAKILTVSYTNDLHDALSYKKMRFGNADAPSLRVVTKG